MSKEIVWSRMNLKEVTPEILYPLTQSSFINSNKLLFIEQYKKMGYYLPEDTEFIRVFHGRAYFNMNVMSKIFSDLMSDPDLMKVSFGGSRSDLIENIDVDELSLFGRIKMLPVYIKILLLFNNIDRISEAAFATIRERYRVYSDKDMKTLTDKETPGYIDSMGEMVKSDLTIIITAGVCQSYMVLRDFLKSFMPIEELDDVINQLVTGSGDIITANQNFALMRLAGDAKNDGAILEALEDSRPYERLEGTRFRQMFDGFLQEFGHRGLYETSIESPRYYEDPDSVLKIIKNYVTAGMIDPQETINRQRKVREAAVENVLKHIRDSKFSYVKKKLFQRHLEGYKRFLALREKNRYHCAMTIALYRRSCLELGRRFAEKGILDEQHDIFFLTFLEAQKLLRGEMSGFNKKVVDERKSERETNSRYHVPDVFVGEFKPGMVKENVREPKNVFTGYAASSGIVQGKARIIHSPEEFGRFKAGEILVAPTTDPMWSTLFPVAKAVVTEMGGVLSHAAIIAREYGTPCVVNVQGIVDALEDGDLIEVDGTSGLVRIINKEIIS